MKLRRAILVTIQPGEDSGYVAECPDLNGVTQGETLDETIANVHEMVALALDGENLAALGFAPSPVIVATLEVPVEPAVA
jgi:predicted RNase H-like HicB family nuclease